MWGLMSTVQLPKVGEVADPTNNQSFLVVGIVAVYNCSVVASSTADVLL